MKPLQEYRTECLEFVSKVRYARDLIDVRAHDLNKMPEKSKHSFYPRNTRLVNIVNLMLRHQINRIKSKINISRHGKKIIWQMQHPMRIKVLSNEMAQQVKEPTAKMDYQFNLQDPRSGRTDTTPLSCPLTSICAHIQTNKWIVFDFPT